MTDGRLRLTILGGWLGAGKTTWLRHQLHEGLRVHVLVNEAANVPVDDALLAEASGITVLSGGCACCDGRAALVASLRDLADRRSQGADLPDLVLETSGLADPSAIIRAIEADPVLVHHVRVADTVVLVDALHGADELARGALAKAQVQAADRVVLTKVDAADEEMVARLAATLRQLSPGAELSAAAAGVSMALSLREAAPFDMPAADDRRVTAATLDLPPGADWPALSLWLSALIHARGEDLVRMKGVVRTPAGRLLIQTVRRTMQPPEILPEGAGADDRLAIVGHGADPERLAKSLRRFLGESDT